MIERAQIEAEILRRLKNRENEQDIILDVSHQLDLNWGDAAAIVRRIRDANQIQITRSTLPIMAGAALVTLIMGLLILLNDVYITFVLRVPLTFGFLPIPFSGNVMFFVLGGAMCGGAIYGLWKEIKRAMK